MLGRLCPERLLRLSELTRMQLRVAEPSHELRDENLYIIKGDPVSKNLEGDPRYKAFLRKMKLPK